jgi:hypothetical protein
MPLLTPDPVDERMPLMGNPPPEIPRDQWKRPLILRPDVDPADVTPEQWDNPRATDKFAGYTRASSLGDMLEDQTGLGYWKQWTVIKGTALRPETILLAAQVCDESDFWEKKRIRELAFDVGGGNEGHRIGTAVHKLGDRIDRGEPLAPLQPPFDACAGHYRRITALFDVHEIEVFLVNDALEGAGTADRVRSPRGWMTTPNGLRIGPHDRLIWDLKTPETAKYFGLKFGAQFATYAGGVPYVHGKGRLPWAQWLAPRTDWGLICHLPRDGSGVGLYWVDLQVRVELDTVSPTPAQLAAAVRCARQQKLVYPAEPPVPEVEDVQLDEVAFMASLRGARTPAQVRELGMAHAALLSDALKAKVNARWAELREASA